MRSTEMPINSYATIRNQDDLDAFLRKFPDTPKLYNRDPLTLDNIKFEDIHATLWRDVDGCVRSIIGIPIDNPTKIDLYPNATEGMTAPYEFKDAVITFYPEFAQPEEQCYHKNPSGIAWIGGNPKPVFIENGEVKSFATAVSDSVSTPDGEVQLGGSSMLSPEDIKTIESIIQKNRVAGTAHQKSLPRRALSSTLSGGFSAAKWALGPAPKWIQNAVFVALMSAVGYGCYKVYTIGVPSVNIQWGSSEVE